MLDAAKRARSNDLARIALPALDGELLQRAGAVTATPSGPEQPFEVVTLPPIEPTLSVYAYMLLIASRELQARRLRAKS